MAHLNEANTENYTTPWDITLHRWHDDPMSGAVGQLTASREEPPSAVLDWLTSKDPEHPLRGCDSEALSRLDETSVSDLTILLRLDDDAEREALLKTKLSGDEKLKDLTARQRRALQSALLAVHDRQISWNEWTSEDLPATMTALTRTALRPASLRGPLAFAGLAIISVLGFGLLENQQEEEATTTESSSQGDHLETNDLLSDEEPEPAQSPAPEISEAPPSASETTGGQSNSPVPAVIAAYGVSDSAWGLYLSTSLTTGYITAEEAAHPENLESLGLTGLAQCDYLEFDSPETLAETEFREFGTPYSVTLPWFRAAKVLCDSSTL